MTSEKHHTYVAEDHTGDDISDAELKTIADGMLKDVLARKAIAQRKLDDDLAVAMQQAETYFRHPKAS